MARRTKNNDKKRAKRAMKNSQKNREKIARIIIGRMKVFKEDDKRLKLAEFDSATSLEKKQLMSDSWIATSYRIDDIFAKDRELNPADSLDDFVRILFQLTGNRPLAATLREMV